MKIIVLNGNVVVNAEQITWVEQAAGQTRIRFSSGDYLVTELTPNEVHELIDAIEN